MSLSFYLFSIGDTMLAKITTNLSPNTCAVISPCSKFIACSGQNTLAYTILSIYTSIE